MHLVESPHKAHDMSGLGGVLLHPAEARQFVRMDVVKQVKLNLAFSE